MNDKRDHSLNVSLGRIITALHSLIPAQHTDEWYAARRFKVGASEIAGFLGYNPHKTIDAGLKEKILTSNTPNPKYLADPCSWGNLLEDAIRKHCEFIYNTTIHETGSVYGSPEQAMSPDGIGVVDVINGDNIESRIVLFEYKCPFARMPVIGQMPDYYIPQVLIGLETLSFCDFALFMEAVIRRAPLNYAGHNNWFDYKYPYCKIKIPEFTTPLCWGAILIVKTNKEIKGNGAEKYKKLIEYANTSNSLLDLGKIDREYMSLMFESLSEGFLKSVYLYQQHPQECAEDWYTQGDLINMANSYENPFGIMRWKMVMKNELFIEKRPLLKTADKYAKLVNDCVKKCGLMDDNLARELHIKEVTTTLKKMSAEEGDIILEPFATRYTKK